MKTFLFSLLLPAFVAAQNCDIPDGSKCAARCEWHVWAHKRLNEPLISMRSVVESEVDCGIVGTTQPDCEAKGCCWHPDGSGSQTPWCFHPANAPGPSPPPPPAPPSGGPPFSASDLEVMWTYFSANINVMGSGAVVASPDLNTPGGSYYYHWARDAALTMYTVLTTIPKADSSNLDKYMQSYISWVNKTHHADDSGNNIDSRIEPKFYIPTAKPYDGAWCRPQNDAPGLRSITIISYANAVLSKSGAGQQYIKSTVWTGSDSNNNGGVVKYDLDWVADNWQSTSCDLWEEVQSNNFFWNRFTMRKAMLLGADFAKSMGDASSSSKYAAAASAMVGDIKGHYNGQFILEEVNRQKDAAVICALNDGYADDGIFGPGSTEVANTISQFSALFHQSYTINQKDDAAGIPGILYGRYEGDTYAGGNPWILTSACLAQLYYRAATAVASADFYEHDVEHVRAWMRAMPSAASGINTTTTANVLSEDATAAELASAMLNAGDGVLDRIKYHTQGNKLHQPEQLDRDTGAEKSATDLTWSYATILKAMVQRTHAQNVIKAL